MTTGRDGADRRRIAPEPVLPIGGHEVSSAAVVIAFALLSVIIVAGGRPLKGALGPPAHGLAQPKLSARTR